MKNELTLEDIKIKQLKENVFHKYFKKEVINYPVSRGGQTVDTYLDIANTNLDIHFGKMNQKYGFKKSREDLLTEYAYQAFEAIQKFEPKVENIELGWEAILKGLDEHLENQLLKYIRTTVTHEMWKFANPDAMKTSTMKDGKKIHYILVMEMESLDNLLHGDYEDSMPMQLSDENAVFDNTMYSYYITFFQKWFDERRAEILQPSQIKFLDDLKKLSRDHYLTPEEFEEVTGVKWRNYSKRLRRIESSITRAWEKENPTNKSRKQIGTEPKIKYLQGFMELVENAEPMTQNLQLTDYLVEGMQDKKVEYEVFKITNEIFELEELKLFNRIVNNKNEKRVSLRAVSLIKVTNRVEEMLEGLLEQYKEVTEYDVNNVDEKNPEKPEITEETTESKVTTYNKDGEVISKEMRSVKDSGSKVFYMLPTGAMTNKKG